MIQINSYFLFKLISLVIFPLLVIISCKSVNFKKEKNRQTFSLESSLCWRGVCIILVVFSHYVEIFHSNGLQVGLLWIYYNVGKLGVAIFVFLSGYALAIKYNEDSMPSFFSIFIRIFRLLIPPFLVNLFFSTLYDINLKECLLRTIKMQTAFGNAFSWGVNWFVAFILAFSVFYYISLLISKKHSNWILTGLTIGWVIGCIILRAQNIWYINAISFILGVFFNKYKDKVINFAYSIFGYMYYMISVIIFIMLYRFERYMPFNLFLITIEIICFINIFIFTEIYIKFNSSVFQLIGKVSYEIFLLHIGIARVVYEYLGSDDDIFIWTLMLTALIAFLLNSVGNIIIRITKNITLLSGNK